MDVSRVRLHRMCRQFCSRIFQSYAHVQVHIREGLVMSHETVVL